MSSKIVMIIIKPLGPKLISVCRPKKASPESGAQTQIQNHGQANIINHVTHMIRIPTVKLKIPEKHFAKYRKCFSQFFHGSVLAKSQPLPLVDS